jgi:hypothetical protein
MEEGCRGKKLFTSWQKGSKERQDWARDKMYFKGIPLVTCSLQLGPTPYFSSLPKMPYSVNPSWG